MGLSYHKKEFKSHCINVFPWPTKLTVAPTLLKNKKNMVFILFKTSSSLLEILHAVLVYHSLVLQKYLLLNEEILSLISPKKRKEKKYLEAKENPGRLGGSIG